ncbi:MAG TPA: RICIN domain-containing protein [Ktedonobacteraceae bacterium]|nr:RICIN domain-containing protein [Ktedonobacteraceae bacterium]
MSRHLRRLGLAVVLIGFVLGLSVFPSPNASKAQAAGETVNVWLTTPDQANLLSPQPNLNFGSVGSNATTINVNEAQTYQQMVGFGASFTDSSAWLVANKMSQSQRDQLMSNMFDPNSGIGLSFLRQPIGSSDLALNEYTYDDVPAGQTDPNLNNFSISHDNAYIIPLLQQALKLNPNLKVMATPWTAPAWMKSNDSLEQGSLNTSAYQAYANYFAKFVQAYQAQGVPIYAVTPQNEPQNNNRMPTMPMSADEETNFIANNLGPTFAQNGISTKILGYDHNWDTPAYPTTILNNSTAASYTPGIAWHCYGGTADAMSTFHNSFPNADTYETECSGGTWHGALWPNEFHDTMELLINSTRNWSKTVTLWGLVLDPNGNPHVNSPDSCSTCRGVVAVDQNSGNVTYNSDYYGLGQASKFVNPGAYRIDSNSFGSGNLEDVAFKNPDGSKTLVVYNSGGNNTFQVQLGNEAFTYTLPAGAAATFKWSGTQSSGGGGSTYYKLVNQNSSKVLDVTNKSTSNGAVIQQWDYVGGANQQWQLVDVGNGYDKVVNRNSGLVLDVTNGSTSNGAVIQQWAFTGGGGANQKWQVVDVGGGYDKIVNQNSGKVLDVTNKSTSNGAVIQQWDYVGGVNQKWQLVPVS